MVISAHGLKHVLIHLSIKALITTEKGQELEGSSQHRILPYFGGLSKEDAPVFQLTTKTWSLIAI